MHHPFWALFASRIAGLGCGFNRALDFLDRPPVYRFLERGNQPQEHGSGRRIPFPGGSTPSDRWKVVFVGLGATMPTCLVTSGVLGRVVWGKFLRYKGN